MGHWLVYWFMLPACVLIAGTATFSGISGAALLTPVFLIGFPLLGVPRLGTVEAIGTSLFLETSGFGAAVCRYLRLRLVDLGAARSLIAVTLPAGALGAVLARYAPVQGLRLGYGAAMLAVAWLLSRPSGGGRRAPRPCPCLVRESERSSGECPEPQRRSLAASDGTRYVYCVRGMGLQRAFSGVGALMAGLISTGVGEATSTVVVASTVAGATVVHLGQLAVSGGLTAIPWNLIVWAVPGAVVGAKIGTRLQGRVSERLTRVFFSALFAGIGMTFLVAFTVFHRRFG